MIMRHISNLSLNYLIRFLIRFCNAALFLIWTPPLFIMGHFSQAIPHIPIFIRFAVISIQVAVLFTSVGTYTIVPSASM